MKLNSFFKQCHEKEVFKMLSIYVVSAWVILQVLSVTWQPLGLPHKTVTLLIIILLLCFPLYLFLIWKLKIVPSQKAEVEISDNNVKMTSVFNKIYFSGFGIISSLCVIIVFFIVNKNFSAENNSEFPTTVSSDKIAVLKFGNNTGDPKYDIVGKMTSDWIIHGITENQVAQQVITQDLIDEYKAILKDKNIIDDETSIVREYLKPSKIISGNFYLKNGKLLFQGMLIDGKTNKTIISFKPTQCPNENPLQCIEDLNESIIGYFITEDKKKLMLQETPPKYEAYKYLIEAKNSNDNQEYISLLNKAIESDSSYFEPKVLRVAQYYNEAEYKKADSLLKQIKPDSYTNKRQLNLLNMYEALLKGDNRIVYKTILKEYEFAPFDLITNKTAMVVALQYVNRPEDVEAIYKTVNMDSMDLQNCSYCLDRIYVKAYADIELGNYSAAIQNIEKTQNLYEEKLLNRPLSIAYVRADNITALNQFLRRNEITSTPAEFQELHLQIGKEFLLKNDKTKANEYFNKILDSDPNTQDLKMLANAFFYKEEYAKAEKIFTQLFAKDPENVELLTKLAICNFEIGNSTQAANNIESLKHLRKDYQFGEVDYALAQYYAATDNVSELYRYLLKAVAGGHKYHWKYFKNDPQFLSYSKSKEFDEVMNFWK